VQGFIQNVTVFVCIHEAEISLHFADVWLDVLSCHKRHNDSYLKTGVLRYSLKWYKI